MTRAVRWVIDTAGSVTATRFRLIMASSSMATALIVGSTLASGGDSGLASQLRAALAALGGNQSSAPATPTRPAAAPAAAPAKSTGPTITAPSIPVSTPTPLPAAAKTPKTKTPKAGRVKHVFVITLSSPGYDDAFGANSKMPYLANQLRPQGAAALELLAAHRRGAAELHRDGRRSGAQRADLGATAPPTRSSPAARSRTAAGTSRGTAASIRRRRSTSPISSSAPGSPGAPTWRTWGSRSRSLRDRPRRPVPRRPACIRAPARRTRPTTSARPIRPRATPAAAMPHATTPSSTSTHCSISGAASRGTSRSTGWTAHSRAGTPNFTFISPNLCNTGEPTQCDDTRERSGPGPG